MSGRVGSLCTGYGGLEQALSELFDFDLAWVSDMDKGADKILAHRYPDTPNLGDFTTVDWASVEPVEVLGAGFPCQPVSHAGKRAGTDDERWLFDDITSAVGLLDPRPRLLVFENVLGLLSANRGHAMARVVHGLAQIGYVGQWRTLRASDVGAPHRRERVFITAESADQRHEWGRVARHGWAGPADGRLLPTPRATRGGSATETVDLLPTPKSTNNENRQSLDRYGMNLGQAIGVTPLLPTPNAADAWVGDVDRSPEAIDRQLRRGDPDGSLRSSSGSLAKDIALTEWGDYAPAIARWETTIGRPAPAPTETGPKGSPRLSPAFVEWMMGLPEGWVTDVPGLTRNEQLKALGNGVVPQQAAAAVGWLLDQITRRGAA